MKCTAGKEDKTKGSTDEGHPEENDADHTIKQRIIKLLNTGFHSESNENEARNAMKLARRLIERYNLDQSVLLRERGDGSLNDFSTTNDDGNCPNALRGGIVNVSVCYRKKGTVLSSLPRWMDFLAQPICANFHVDAFKTIARATTYKKGECTISFYGIKTNAQLAAYAYKIATERISLMAALYESPAMNRRSPSHVRTVRLSYALGIVDGLNRDVTEEACHEDSDDNKQSSGNHLTLEQLECENAAQLALIDHQKKIAEDILKVSLFFLVRCQ
jgi:predicted secreted protein